MQESFYGRFKIALGDPERFSSVGELVEAIYQTLHYFSHVRIKGRLKCAPSEFRKRWLEKEEVLRRSARLPLGEDGS